MSLLDDIQKLRQESGSKLAEADRLVRLIEAFPDLKKHVGRWNKVAYYSKSVNSKVTRFDLRHNCGCCSDSPLEVWPYQETEHGNIYSDPPCFQVGERSYLGGDTPYSAWEDKLKTAGIPESIIGAIEMHFERCRKEALESVEEAYGGSVEEAYGGSDE